MPILRAEGLQKTYKGRKVVNGVSVEIAPGEIVGLLGPNGAGKTTSFYMMVGLVKPDGGRVRWTTRTSRACRCTGAPMPGSAIWRRSRAPFAA